jgi:hypothetical protein
MTIPKALEDPLAVKKLADAAEDDVSQDPPKQENRSVVRMPWRKCRSSRGRMPKRLTNSEAACKLACQQQSTSEN